MTVALNLLFTRLYFPDLAPSDLKIISVPKPGEAHWKRQLILI